MNENIEYEDLSKTIFLEVHDDNETKLKCSQPTGLGIQHTKQCVSIYIACETTNVCNVKTSFARKILAFHNHGMQLIVIDIT